MDQRPASRIPSPAQPAANLPFSEFSQRLENMTFTAPPPGDDAKPEDLPEFVLRRPPSPVPRFDFSEPEWPRETRIPVPDTHGPLFPGGQLPEPETYDALRDLRSLGQIHDSFIIAAGRDGLWIIDQHVAHERILFEQVLAAREKGAAETQGLLIPLVIQLTAAHCRRAELVRL
jgi:DNA mismatch repair protein MutL